MKKTNFLFVLFFSCIFSLSAQENKKNSKNLPVSIYTFIPAKNLNSFSIINKKLNLSNFDFVYANSLDIDYNLFSLDFRNMGKTPSEFIYDDYKRYQNNNLLKGFLRKNDPTRRNFQCFQNSFQ